MAASDDSAWTVFSNSKPRLETFSSNHSLPLNPERNDKPKVATNNTKNASICIPPTGG
ncbi:MAG: hypothetical protein KAH20_03385 [Methylococcales bacterium]|nr:hypothetical protein [Methylococcales bacterium]